MIEHEEGLSVAEATQADGPQNPSEANLRTQIEALVREAMSLYEQNRLSEALLACEGALAVDPDYLPALSLKGLIHERLGQRMQAIQTYERVIALNPMSVSERARLEALRRQSASAVAQVRRPLWLETLPVVLAFLGASLVLLLGLLWVIRLSASPPSSQVALAPAPAPNSQTVPYATAVPPASPSPVPAPPPSSQGLPPVVVDPSRLRLTPEALSQPPSPPTGPIHSLPNPETQSQNGSGDTSKPPETPSSTSGEVLPDVSIQERDPGVYEIQVFRSGEATRRSSQPSSSQVQELLNLARSHQLAGNYQSAIEIYLRALPNAPSPGEVHQQIAICYLRLNDKARARAHFQQAISAYERQIQEGREVESARQGISACQNGLRLCEE